MWMKIAAGLVAALAVVGVGVYVAMPPSDGGCGSKCGLSGSSEPQLSCCSAELAACPIESGSCGGDAAVCPLSAAKVDSTALAAFTGGMAACAISGPEISAVTE